MIRNLALQKESLVGEERLVPDHVRMPLSIPHKQSVSYVVGLVKGKGAIPLARVYSEQERSFGGRHSCAWGCFVSPV